MTWAKELNLTHKQAQRILKKKGEINKWAFNQIEKCKLCKWNKSAGWGFSCLEHINKKAVTEKKMAQAFRNIIKIAQKKAKE